MIGIRRALEIFQVAANAGRRGDVVVVVDVAVDTLPRWHGVPARQRKPHRSVIKLCIEPVVRAVAAFAGGGKAGGHVVWVGRLLEIRSVAGVARRGHGLELTVGRALVAGVAIYGRVRSRQWKSIVMLLDLLNRNLPAPYRMALLAIRPQLPLMNVRVAVLASLPHIGEHRLHVTLDATYGLVHTP